MPDDLLNWFKPAPGGIVSKAFMTEFSALLRWLDYAAEDSGEGTERTGSQGGDGPVFRNSRKAVTTPLTHGPMGSRERKKK